ncbi:hypothetical protein [Jonesia quinghaiensis]|uniref:hypothetical protein n=1 Tax=Jonesia quinghaiensis TaxID=262806 RepID=UPI00041D5324|nr:hypothetical protein [Jonesia quinghaiensis]
MFPGAQSSQLTPEQSEILDAQYFKSDPYLYYRSRIDSILHWVDSGDLDRTQGMAATVWQRLGRKGLEDKAPPAKERDSFAAIEAFMLRHHLAEAIARFTWACINQDKTSDEKKRAGFYLALVDSPMKTGQVLTTVIETLAQDTEGLYFNKLLMPGDLLDAVRAGEFKRDEVEAVFHNLCNWLWRSFDVIDNDRLPDLNSAYNKMKHGFAVRPDNRLRMDLLSEPPKSERGYSVQELNGPKAHKFLTGYTASFLSRNKRDGAWDYTAMNIPTDALLAECEMLAMVYGALFRARALPVARSASEQWRVADYPPVSARPTPEEFLKNSGYNGVVTAATFKKDGSPCDRSTIFSSPAVEWPATVQKSKKFTAFNDPDDSE